MFSDVKREGLVTPALPAICNCNTASCRAKSSEISEASQDFINEWEVRILRDLRRMLKKCTN